MPKKSAWRLFPTIEGLGATPVSTGTSEQNFMKMFSRKAVEQIQRELDGWLTKRGWKIADTGAGDDWVKDGVRLGSPEAFEFDREAKSRDDAFVWMMMIMKRGEEFPESRPHMMTAFSAGTHYAASIAYMRKSREATGVGAPDKMTPEIVAEAVKRFVETPGNRLTAPTFKMVRKPPYWQHENSLTSQHFTKWTLWAKAAKSKSAG